MTGLSPKNWFGVGLAVLMAVSVAVSFVIRQVRRRSYARHCFERGYRLESGRDGEAQRHVAICPLFSEGWGQFWGFTITGTIRGVPFTAFEYDWETGPRKFSKSHTIAAILWLSERDDLPSFLNLELGAARAGREIMFWREGQLPQPRCSTSFLPMGITGTKDMPTSDSTNSLMMLLTRPPRKPTPASILMSTSGAPSRE